MSLSGPELPFLWRRSSSAPPPQFRRQLVLLLRVRRRPQFLGIGRCSRFLYDPTRVGRRAGCRCVGRSGSPSFGAVSACRINADPSGCLPPSPLRALHTAGLSDSGRAGLNDEIPRHQQRTYRKNYVTREPQPLPQQHRHTRARTPHPVVASRLERSSIGSTVPVRHCKARSPTGRAFC